MRFRWCTEWNNIAIVSLWRPNCMWTVVFRDFQLQLMVILETQHGQFFSFSFFVLSHWNGDQFKNWQKKGVATLHFSWLQWVPSRILHWRFQINKGIKRTSMCEPTMNPSTHPFSSIYPLSSQNHPLPPFSFNYRARIGSRTSFSLTGSPPKSG